MKSKTYKPKNVNKSMATGISVGIGAALLVSILLTSGLTSMVINEKAGNNASSVFIFIIRALSVLLGGLIGTGVCKEKKLPVIGFSALGYLIILLGLGIVVYDGSFQNFGIGLFSVLSGGLLAWAIRLKPKAKSNLLKQYRK